MPRTLTRQGDVRKEIEDTHAALEANKAELPHLEVHRDALWNLLELIRLCTTEQDVHRANKQISSKRLKGALDEGRKVLTVVRVILRQHYGSDNEKLQEFGVQPFRGKPRQRPAPVPVEDKPPVPPKDEPSEPESES